MNIIFLAVFLPSVEISTVENAFGLKWENNLFYNSIPTQKCILERIGNTNYSINVHLKVIYSGRVLIILQSIRCKINSHTIRHYIQRKVLSLLQ